MIVSTFSLYEWVICISGMFFFIIHAIAVTASVKASLPRLIMSSRVSRGYAYEDRVTRIKNIDAAVDSIPDIGELVPVAMKATLIAFFDMYKLMLKLNKLFAELWAMCLKSKGTPANPIHGSRVRAAVEETPTEVVGIIKNMLVSYQQLLKWDSEMEVKVTGLVTEINKWIYFAAFSLRSVTKKATGEKLRETKELLRGDPLDPLFMQLNDYLGSVIVSTIRSSAMNYLLEAKDTAALASARSNQFLMQRLQAKLVGQSYLTTTFHEMQSSLPKMTRTLKLSVAASVTGTFLKYQWFPSLFSSPDIVKLKGDESKLVSQKVSELDTLGKSCEQARHQLAAFQYSVESLPWTHAVSRVKQLTTVIEDIGRQHEVAFFEIEALRAEHLARVYAPNVD